ncbi:MAG: DUF58 domain-containing protein [Dehalococcoidia bacterium]|nr:DUF58 domain-containing protein [Dehalococcoidia bacterium]
MKVWLGVALSMALFIAGLVTGNGYFFRLSYLVAGVLAVGLVWARVSLWGLEVAAGRRPQRLRAGTTFRETITVRNLSPLPKVGVQVIEESALPGVVRNHSVNLAPGSEASIALDTPPLERGCYFIGPTWVYVSDPFGVFRRKRMVRPVSDLIVHPKVFHLTGMPSPRSELSGESRCPQRLPYLTAKAVDVREYYPGDGLNRIHWPLTARWQKLMVKEFEIDPSHNVFVILDLEDSEQKGSGQESTKEYGLSLAASLSQHFLGQGFALGLVAHGEPGINLMPDRGSRQLMRVMDSLAEVRVGGEVSLLEAVSRHERSLGRRELAVVITPSSREDWVGSAQLLAHRGVRLMVILMEPTSFGPGSNSLLVYSSLVASRIPTFLYNKGDSLSRVLAQGGRGH